MLGRTEFDFAVIIEAGSDATVGSNGLDHRKIPTGDPKLFIRRGELGAVPGGERVYYSAVDANTREPAWIILKVMRSPASFSTVRRLEAGCTATTVA